MKPPISRDPSGPRQDKGPQLLTDRIRATEVRLVSDEKQYGVVSRREAEDLAREMGLDLIVMSLDSSPPVVRLMDYGKYKYEKDRKEREARKKQHVIEIKEVKMGVRIDKHDFEIKSKHAQEFLQAGDKVKCSIRLRGREIQHADLAMELARRFIEFLAEYGAPKRHPKWKGEPLRWLSLPIKRRLSPCDSDPVGLYRHSAVV